MTAGRDLPGIERIEARLYGAVFTPHRHDSYGLGVTLSGVQTFHYRGASRASLPGQVIILHPDELHDGAAGTEAGLRYRMLYLEPARLAEALDHRDGLPFVAQPVIGDLRLRALLLEALATLDQLPEPLFIDSLMVALATALHRHGGAPPRRLPALARRQVALARDYLLTHWDQPVASARLEAVTGLDRFALARHFRAVYGTSPHRFHILRRLDQARRLIRAGGTLADSAAAAGFADQAHFTRHFRKSYGLSPGRWAGLIGETDFHAFE